MLDAAIPEVQAVSQEFHEARFGGHRGRRL
jgi:hypothetical protein